MKTWKTVCVVSLALNLLLLSLWLAGHLRYERAPAIGPVRTARMVQGDPMSTLPEHSRAMAHRVIRAYDGFVRSKTDKELSIDEAYRQFFASALEGYYDEDWDIWQLVPGNYWYDRVARILFREPHDLLPIVSLSYVSPTILSTSYSPQDEDLVAYSGWSLSLAGIRGSLFFRSLMANNGEWANLIERASACGDFLPPGFLMTLRDHPEYFDFSDDATRLYIALVFLDRYIQYNSSYRLVI